ncbi:MAG: putative metallopeptidase [Candidatus Pacearchaeota archaeon]
MKIKYYFDNELHNRVISISNKLFPHIKTERIKSIRSYGSSSKNTIARCHALGKLMQMVIGTKAYYGIEFISEQFDRLSKEEQDKVIIHELMHIPKNFGGGFKHHDYVCDKNINLFHKKLKQIENANI